MQVGTAKIKARAWTATGEERARLWDRALEFWPPYADYQRKTERGILFLKTIYPSRKATRKRGKGEAA
jgi:hypothetical protein